MTGPGAPTLLALAPAKVNLCLYVGPTRPDGRHELVSVMASLALADELRLEIGPDGLAADEVLCPGVEGPNLAATALAAFRAATGWDGPPLRLSIDKRIPVAGGMAGGSADAAAALRLAAAAAGLDDPTLLEEIATGLGADVPSQVSGGPVLAGGAGEVLRPLAQSDAALHLLVVPTDAALGAGEVYAEADRLGLTRDAGGLAEARARVEAAVADAPDPASALLQTPGLVHNDLQEAARSLCPAIDRALTALDHAGVDHAIVCGSGPTVVGLFTHSGAAFRAAYALAGRAPTPVLTTTVPAHAGAVRPEPAPVPAGRPPRTRPASPSPP